MICAVPGCNKSHHKKEDGFSMHRFPSGKSPEAKSLRKVWVEFCSIKDESVTNRTCICSDHFTENDFQRDLQNELLGLPLRRMLKKDAYPTIKDRKNFCRKNSKSDTIVITVMANGEVRNSEQIKEDLKRKKSKENRLLMEADSYKNKHQCLMSQYIKLKEKFISMKKMQRKKIGSLQNQLKYWKKKKSQRPPKSKSDIRASEILEKLFTKNQINLLSGKKARVNWTAKEMQIAFTVKFLSEKCYSYLRCQLGYPLPSPSVIQKWATQLGVNKDTWDGDALRIVEVASLVNAESQESVEFNEELDCF